MNTDKKTRVYLCSSVANFLKLFVPDGRLQLEVIMADKDRNEGSNPQRQDTRSSQGRQGQMGQYHCERCNTNFNSRKELNQHEQRMHENEMQPDRR